jgi:hypothetical protein
MTSTPEPTGDNPRGFSQATGFVFQAIGMVLLLVGCCVFSLSGKFQSELGRPVGSFGEWIEVATVPQLVAGLDMILTFTTGIALVTVGIGLQGDRPSAGIYAVIVTVIFAAGWWASLIAQATAGGTWWQIGLSLVMAAVGTVLFLLAGNSARTLRLNPAPPDEDDDLSDLERPATDRQVDDAIRDLEKPRRTNH